MCAFWFTADFTRRTLPGGKDADRSLQAGHFDTSAERWRAGGPTTNLPPSHTFKSELESTQWTPHGFSWTPSTILSPLGLLLTPSSTSSLAGQPQDA